MLTKKSRAMVLVITLLISAIIALFLISTVKMLPVMGFSSVNLEDKQQAMAAARSGVDYARARLQEDPAWRGDGNEMVVDTPEFKVVEDNGNVYGFLTPANGPASHFRLRFNYQNGGAAPEDDLAEPTFPMDTPYVSYNNLKASYGRPQYRAVEAGGAWKVDSTSPTAQTLPKYTAALIVEGFAGPAVADISPTAPLVSASHRKYTRQVVEVYLTRPGFVAVDSAVMAAKELKAALNDGQTMKIDSSETGAPARVRSLEKMEVYSSSGTGANYQMPPDGEVVVNLGQDFLLNGLSSTAPAATRQTPMEQSPHWLRVGFDDIQRAPSTAPKLKAGTYVWVPSGLGAPKLEYFPENYDPTKTYSGGTVINNGDDMLASGSGAVSLAKNLTSMKFTNEVLVEPQGTATDFTVVSAPGLMSSLGLRPQVLLAPPTTSDRVIISNDSGSVHFEGKIEGEGAITSFDDITFQGSSVLEADPDASVALYAKGDINLKAIPEEMLPVLSAAVTPVANFHHNFRRHHHGHRGHHGRHRGWSGGGSGGSGGSSGGSTGGSGFPVVFSGAADVAFAGVVYAQGEFHANLKSVKQDGTPGSGQNGSLYVEGILATYGGDPDANSQPGVTGTGVVDLDVADATFVFAPEYLDSLVGIDGPSRLELSFWSEL